MRLEGTGHKFVFEYGTSFPKNPKIGSVFCRTDINNTHFQYDGKSWTALATDAKMSYDAYTNQTRPANPVTAEAILAASESSIVIAPDGTIQGVVGENAPQDAIDAATLMEHLSGASTSADLSLVLDKMRLGPDAGKLHEQQTPEKPDWVNGEFVPGGTRHFAYSPTDLIPVVQKEKFDLDGNFVRRESCYQIETNRQGIFIDNTGQYTSPYDNCDCTLSPGCPQVPWLTVTSRETDPLAGLNSFRVRWGRPEGFAESLYEYRIEAVQYPKDFTGAEFTTALWSGTCGLTNAARAVSIIDGPLMTVDQYKGKVLYIVANEGNCRKPHIIEGNSERTFYLNIPVSTMFWREQEYCEVWEPFWENVDYYTVFPIVTSEGAVYADRYADSYEMDIPAMNTSMWFRITAVNWWGEGPYTYTDDFIPINPCPYDIEWVTAYGELGTIYAKVTGLAPNDVTVDGFELCYSSETDENPETALVGALSGDCYVLWSQTGTWAVGVNKPVYLHARSLLGDCYSNWIGYGEIPDGADLETTLVNDNLLSHVTNDPCSYMQYRGPTPGTTTSLRYIKFASPNRAWLRFYNPVIDAQHYGYVNGVTYSGSTGVRITGTIIDMNGAATPFPTYYGFFIGSTDELNTGNTYFIGLESQCYGALTANYAVLFRCVDRVLTEEISRSVELNSAGYDLDPLSVGFNAYNMIIEARSGRFKIYVSDDEVLNVEDDTLVLSASSYYLGWTFYCRTFYQDYVIGPDLNGINGYFNFKVDRINYLGRVALVDPGLAVDTLRDEYTPEITYPFPVTEYVRFHTTNASGDYIRLELDDNRQPYIEVYNDYYNYIEDIGLVTEDELSLDGLSDVSILNPSDYQTLMYIGNKWVNISDDDFNYHNELKVTPYDAKISVSETDILMGNLDSSHYTPVTFVNSNTYVASGCQVCVVFDTSALITSGFLNSNGGDLRVYSADGEYLPFWWQPETWNTTQTKLWVRVSEIPASGSLRCFITYGKSDMTTAMSNGESVFEFFDDFTKYDLGSSIDGQYGWNVEHLSPTDGKADIVTNGTTRCLRVCGVGHYSVVTHPFTYDRDAYSLYHRGYQRDGNIGFCSDGAEISFLGVPEEGAYVDNGGLGITYKHYDADVLRYSGSCSSNFLYGNYWYTQKLKRYNGVVNVHTVTPYVTAYEEEHNTTLSDSYTSVSGFTDIFIGSDAILANALNIDWIFVTKAYTTDISYILGLDTSNTVVNVVDIDLSTYDIKLEQGLLSFAAIDDTPVAVTGYGKIFTNGDTLYFLDQAGNLYNLLEGTGTTTNTGCAGFDQYVITAVSGTFDYVIPTGAVSGSVIALNGQLWTEGETNDYVIAGLTLTVSSGITLYNGDRITVYYPICLADSEGGGTSSNADTLDGHDSSYFATAAHNHDSSYSALGHTHTDINAITLDGLDSTDFSLVDHTHYQYSPTGHTHVNVDATTLSGIAASGFALAGHSHASSADADTLDGYHADAFSLSGHTHYQYSPTGHTHTDINAALLDGFDSLYFSPSGHTHVNIDAITLSGIAASGFALVDHIHSGTPAAGVTKIIAGTNISISSTGGDGTGEVTITSTASGSCECSGGGTISELSDVVLTDLENGQTLVYDSSTSMWVNSYVSGTSSEEGVNIDATTLSGIAASGFATADHTHDFWDTHTKLLLHLNGDNGVITSGFNDSSMYAYAGMAVGDAKISTAQGKFGGSSLYLDGTGDYLIYPMSGLWDTGHGDLSVECFGRLSTDVNTGLSDLRMLVAKGNVEAVNGAWCFGIGHDASWGSNVRMNLSWRVGGSYGYVTSGEIACLKDNWYHFAFMRKNNYLYLYFNGTVAGSGACVATFTSYNAYPPILTIGSRFNVSWAATALFTGYINEVRYSSTARWSVSGFTPTTAQYSPYL